MKVHSSPIDEHAEVPLGDQGRYEALVTHWTRFDEGTETPAGANACYVVSVHGREERDSADSQLAEIVSLVQTRGDSVVGQSTYELGKPDPKTLLRSGVAQRIADEARELGANLLVLDADLSPSQTRNLEDSIGLSVCDREAVILDVFERHAKTRRARLQVAIAHLEYLRPRIRGIGLNMDQQAGGIMGGRGPGETASEILARRIDTRLSDLKRQARQLTEAAASARKHRSSAQRVAVVGYTNAGKTTLMNALTGAELSAKNRPFETLDATSRCLTRHGGDVLLSDTVGFIRKLPERLLASFESTLAEVSEASLLLLVLDASDPEWPMHLETTRGVLQKLGAEQIPRFVVFNKLDRAEQPPHPDELRAACGDAPHMVVSAKNPDDVARLKEALLSAVRARQVRRNLFVPYADSESMKRIYASCRVIDSAAHDGGMRFVIEGEPHIVEKLAERCPPLDEAELGSDEKELEEDEPRKEDA